MVKVLIPQPLQNLTKGKSEVEVQAGTVASVIAELDRQFPGIAERITEGGKVRKFVNIYVNEEDIRFLKGEETLVGDDTDDDDTEISIVPALAGG